MSYERDREADTTNRTASSDVLLEAGSSERRNRAGVGTAGIAAARTGYVTHLHFLRALAPTSPSGRVASTRSCSLRGQKVQRDERSNLSARHGDSREKEGARQEREGERMREGERKNGVKWVVEYRRKG